MEKNMDKELDRTGNIIFKPHIEINPVFKVNPHIEMNPVIHDKPEVTKTESMIDQLANPASLTGFIVWVGTLIITIYGYAKWNFYLQIFGIIIFLILVILKLIHK